MNVIFFFAYIRELIKSILTPLPLFWLLLIAVFVFYKTGYKRIAKWMLGSSVLWFLLISTPFLPRNLLARLENQYSPVQLLPGKADQNFIRDSIVHILVLGSGYETDDRLSYNGQLNSSGLARLLEAIRLLRHFPDSRLIFSGNAGRQPMPQAEISALAAQELGIDSTVIYTNCEPWNTKDEAEKYFKRFGAKYKLYLITDASHIPRAMMHFRNAGLKPVAAPANFMIKKNNQSKNYTDYFPSSQNIRCMEIVFNEYLGMLWAKIGGD